MIPVQEDHVANALALIISQYAGKPVLQGLITSYMNRMNEIEAAIYQVISAFDISSAPPLGAALDALAGIVGEKRNSQTDAQLWATMQARIVANKSRGSADDIIRAANFFGSTSYTEGNAAWQITFSGANSIATPENCLRILNLARAAGYRGVVQWCTGTPTIPAVWGDAVSGLPLVPSWPGDAVSGSPGLNVWNSQQVG